MRKTLAVISIMALVLVGFLALANPVAACGCCCPPITKTPYPYCTQFDLDEIPLGWDAWVRITIQVHNYDNEDTMTDVVVKDNLGAEWEVEGVTSCCIDNSPCPTANLPVFTTKGGSEKVFMEWDIGTLGPCKHAKLVFWISTDENPAGHQEFTTCDEYELNSGATLKYKIDGKQHSYSTESIMVTVVDIEPPEISNYPPDWFE